MAIVSDQGAKVARIFMLMAIVGAPLLLAACDEADGPAEKAGEAIDEAVKDTQRAVKDATD